MILKNKLRDLNVKIYVSDAEITNSIFKKPRDLGSNRGHLGIWMAIWPFGAFFDIFGGIFEVFQKQTCAIPATTNSCNNCRPFFCNLQLAQILVIICCGCKIVFPVNTAFRFLLFFRCQNTIIWTPNPDFECLNPKPFDNPKILDFEFLNPKSQTPFWILKPWCQNCQFGVLLMFFIF